MRKRLKRTRRVLVWSKQNTSSMTSSSNFVALRKKRAQKIRKLFGFLLFCSLFTQKNSFFFDLVVPAFECFLFFNFYFHFHCECELWTLGVLFEALKCWRCWVSCMRICENLSRNIFRRRSVEFENFNFWLNHLIS